MSIRQVGHLTVFFRNDGLFKQNLQSVYMTETVSTQQSVWVKARTDCEAGAYVVGCTIIW